MKDKPNIKLNKCESSNVGSYGYCPDTNVLAVQYKGGKTYYYPDFSADKFAEMQKAKSVGSFVSKEVKGRKFHTFDK